ncbi:hypothetical protein PR202_ga11216 [Eleusine coracana subsp. coracana]|uniref:DNA replication complex GINS protein SLD5 n=1 Tax=Eleusine coracana subsp. coracana TaxID=191504 RepID=A0AAV5C8Y4_ELECO|nr:hypothetical protein PR202_ga11216 [Eleusine coracana subsp. coracana]
MSSWDDDDESASASASAATTDVELLKRAWRNEKAAPEVLRFDKDLVDRVREQIQLLEETLDDFADSGVDDLVVSLYQMDLDRTLFLLRSYLRLRLQKIEKYTMHISRSQDLKDRLSEQEQKFAKSCGEIMEKHLKQSVLSKLPYGYGDEFVTKQSLSSTEDDMTLVIEILHICMNCGPENGLYSLPTISSEHPDLICLFRHSVPEPQLDTFVFCKTKSDVGAFQLDDIGEEVVDLVADDLYVLRYKSIKGLVEGGRIDLI